MADSVLATVQQTCSNPRCTGLRTGTHELQVPRPWIPAGPAWPPALALHDKPRAVAGTATKAPSAEGGVHLSQIFPFDS